MEPMSTKLETSFNTVYEGYPAAVFDNTLEYNNFTLKLKRAGKSFSTKIVKGKRAGKTRRNFVVMLVDTTVPAESQGL